MAEDEFSDNLDGPHGREQAGSKLLVKRAAYRRFSRWMDRELADLVARWAHLAPPNVRRFAFPARRRSQT